MTVHCFDPTILREYDIRGIVGEYAHARRCAGDRPRLRHDGAPRGGKTVALGYDGRLSSPALADACVEGLRAAGVDVLRIGLGATPMLYFAVHHLDADGGIMVTGSHNPPDHNGFKMMLGQEAVLRRRHPGAGRDGAAGRLCESGQRRGRASGRCSTPMSRGVLKDFKPRHAAQGRLGRRQRRRGRGDPRCRHQAAGRAHRPVRARSTAISRPIIPTRPCPRTCRICSATVKRAEAAISASPSTATATASAPSTARAASCGATSCWRSCGARRAQGRSPARTIIADVKASQVLFDEIARAAASR